MTSLRFNFNLLISYSIQSLPPFSTRTESTKDALLFSTFSRFLLKDSQNLSQNLSM